MLLAGLDLDGLDFRNKIAVTEAVLLEPALSGSGTSADEMLNKFEHALMEANPDPATWGTSAESQAAAQAAESMWGVVPTPPVPAPEPTIAE